MIASLLLTSGLWATQPDTSRSDLVAFSCGAGMSGYHRDSAMISFDFLTQLHIGPIVTRFAGQFPIVLWEKPDFKMAPGQSKPERLSYFLNPSIGYEWHSGSPKAAVGAGWNWARMDSWETRMERRPIYRNDTATVQYTWLWVKTHRENEPFLFAEVGFEFSNVIWNWRLSLSKNSQSVGTSYQVIFPIL